MIDVLLNSKDAARLLACDEKTLALWRRRRTGPAYVRLGSRLVRYTPTDLQHWITANKRSGVTRHSQGNSD